MKSAADTDSPSGAHWNRLWNCMICNNTNGHRCNKQYIKEISNREREREACNNFVFVFCGKKMNDNKYTACSNSCLIFHGTMCKWNLPSLSDILSQSIFNDTECFLAQRKRVSLCRRAIPSVESKLEKKKVNNHSTTVRPVLTKWREEERMKQS